MKATSSGSGSANKEKNIFENMFGGKKNNKSKKDEKIADSISNSEIIEEKIKINSKIEKRSIYTLPNIPLLSNKNENEQEEILGLSRVLVWLMAPVAAEYLKYGKTLVSDPRRSIRLLSILEKVQGSENNGGNNSENTKNAKNKEGNVLTLQDVFYKIPINEEDKKVLLHWAFFEATTIIRQYGDLLEEVNSYLATGTSTVGECVLLVEDELR